jgi:hypothetical protein
MSDEQYAGVDVCAFCGDPVECDHRCTEDLVDARIREFREIRAAKARVVREDDHERDSWLEQAVASIQRAQVLAYGPGLADKEKSNE